MRWEGYSRRRFVYIEKFRSNLRLGRLTVPFGELKFVRVGHFAINGNTYLLVMYYIAIFDVAVKRFAKAASAFTLQRFISIPRSWVFLKPNYCYASWPTSSRSPELEALLWRGCELGTFRPDHPVGLPVCPAALGDFQVVWRLINRSPGFSSRHASHFPACRHLHRPPSPHRAGDRLLG